jgi:diadenosine tetraphosphate (Ap4A) HIT family hydrolase
MVAVTGSLREAKMSEVGWSLHPQLAADTVAVCDLALSRLLAMNDANFPWLVVVPRRVGVSEIIDLGDEQAVLMNEISLVSRALKHETRCDKLNVAAIGNVVAQLHIHIVARRKDDAAWPKPVWGAVPRRDYEADAMERFVAAIRGRVCPTKPRARRRTRRASRP